MGEAFHTTLMMMRSRRTDGLSGKGTIEHACSDQLPVLARAVPNIFDFTLQTTMAAAAALRMEWDREYELYQDMPLVCRFATVGLGQEGCGKVRARRDMADSGIDGGKEWAICMNCFGGGLPDDDSSDYRRETDVESNATTLGRTWEERKMQLPPPLLPLSPASPPGGGRGGGRRGGGSSIFFSPEDPREDQLQEEAHQPWERGEAQGS